MRIEWQSKVEDTRFLDLRVDGSLWREIHKTSFARKLSPLMSCTTQEELIRVFFKIECSVAELAALRLLAKRDYFTFQMRKRLKERRLSDKSVDYALDKCLSLGYLDDERLTESFISFLKRKGKGPRYIAQKLKERLGFLPDISRDLDEEKALVAQLLKKKFPHLCDGGERERSRAIRFLLGRGFEMGLIIQEVKKLDKR